MPDKLRQERSYCRICSGMCGLIVTIADDRIVGVSGDKDHPLTRGFACSKSPIQKFVKFDSILRFCV
jgi:anaerobic selenocysteine-containing dehydrogenase